MWSPVWMAMLRWRRRVCTIRLIEMSVVRSSQ
jgi:hypothetical protein